MADLRIVDAPEIPTENITGEEKLPTGGNGNYSISLDSLADYTKTKKDLADNTSVDGKVNGVRQELDAHIEDLLNPHQVTKGQVGLGNVDNTADADKPVSNSTQAAIISAFAPKADKTYVDTQLTLKANKADVYTKSETYTKQESSDLVSSSISTALNPVNSSLDLAKRGVVNRYDYSLTYNIGERVVLTNGDIVKSTISGNTNDPNVNMTGWKNPLSTENILYQNGYSVESALYYLTPEMFGAVGDGVTDDQAAIQSMLNAGAIGCVFEFDGSKTYYNAFNASGGYVNHYDADPLSKQWIRRGGCTFKFNGCNLKRKKPFGDINSGTSTYTDYDSSLILVWEAENVFIHGGTLDSGGELGVFVNLASEPIESTRGKYCVADVQVHGLRLHKCKNVFLDNVHSHKAYFNIFIDQCENVYGTVQGNYAVQSPIKTSAPNDMNLGGSLKVWFSENIDLKMYGKYNANATAEIEKFNTNVRIVGSCDNDFSNGIVIISTKHCYVDWTSRNVLEGSGAQITAGGISADDYCSHISGNITVQNTSWAGLLITVPDGTTTDWFGLNLNVVTSGCAYSGLIVENNSTKAILGSKIHHDSTDNGVRGSRTFKGNLPIYVSGSSYNNNFGLWMLGTNTKTMCPTFNLDLRTCAAPYTFEAGSYAMFESVKLADKVLFATNDVPLAFGQLNDSGSYNNRGTVIFYQSVSIDRAEYPILENVRSVHGTNNKRVWYDATQATTVTGGKEYPLKLFIAD